MAPLTVRLVGVCVPSQPARNGAPPVLFHRDGLKMIWVHAPAVATQVVNVEAIWYLASVQFVGDSVCLKVFSINLDRTVTVAIAISLPKPATRFLIPLNFV